MIKKITPLFIFFISISFFAQNTTTLDAKRDKTELLIGFNRRSDGPSAGAPFWTDPTFKPLLATMNPDIVRYPGGTQANYWDWSTGEFIPNSGKNMNSKEYEFNNIHITKINNANCSLSNNYSTLGYYVKVVIDTKINNYCARGFSILEVSIFCVNCCSQ